MKKQANKPAKRPAKAAKKATTPAKAKKAAPKAKPATPPKAAKSPAKPATPPPPANDKPAAAKFTPVPLPAHFATPGGCEFDITATRITLTEGLREVIFNPAQAELVRHDLAEIDGHKLPEVIPAGTVALVRGDVLRLVPRDYADIIAAILTARNAARAAKRAKKGGAE